VLHGSSGGRIGKAGDFMKDTATLREALGLLRQLAADDDLFGQAPGDRQFALGAATALAWTLDEDRPFSQMLACARTRTAPEKAAQMRAADSR
jgi:hypothetical protein